MGHYFFSQSAPDIWHKLQKLQMAPQTPLIQMSDTAFSVSKNWNLEESRKEMNWEQRQVNIMAIPIGHS